MSRAWPFEGKEEFETKVNNPKDFIAAYGSEGSEAVVVRIGMNDAQLVLVDREGRWDRWVYTSVEAAEEAGRALGIDVHVGEYPEATRVRIGQYVPPDSHFDEAAYPEQGQVGPLSPYPENRPRDLTLPKRSGPGSALEG
ncbi:MAG: hypothetical protein QOH90_708 [Actinomycetota bacterium]|jgi:hypothetical protein|nr:hypothetical protein [Actinomycetota bacterium]